MAAPTTAPARTVSSTRSEGMQHTLQTRVSRLQGMPLTNCAPMRELHAPLLQPIRDGGGGPCPGARGACMRRCMQRHPARPAQQRPSRLACRAAHDSTQGSACCSEACGTCAPDGVFGRGFGRGGFGGQPAGGGVVDGGRHGERSLNPGDGPRVNEMTRGLLRTRLRWDATPVRQSGVTRVTGRASLPRARPSQQKCIYCRFCCLPGYPVDPAPFATPATSWAAAAGRSPRQSTPRTRCGAAAACSLVTVHVSVGLPLVLPPWASLGVCTPCCRGGIGVHARPTVRRHRKRLLMNSRRLPWAPGVAQPRGWWWEP